MIATTAIPTSRIDGGPRQRPDPGVSRTRIAVTGTTTGATTIATTAIPTSRIDPAS